MPTGTVKASDGQANMHLPTILSMTAKMIHLFAPFNRIAFTQHQGINK